MRIVSIRRDQGRTALMLFGFIFAAAGSAAILFSFSVLKNGRASVDWPKADATVISSEVKKSTSRRRSGSP